MAVISKVTKRGWVFVLYDYTTKDEEHIQEVICSKCAYGVYGCRLDENKIQGYIELHSDRTSSAVNKLLPRCDMKWRLGTPQQARDECVIDSTSVFEHGIFPKGQGSRTDKILTAELVVREHLPSVVWLYGPDKEAMALDARKMSVNPWIGRTGLDYWYSYDGQKNVIIEDFIRSDCTCRELIRIIGSKQCTISTGRGPKKQLLANHIVITSEHSPRSIYDVTPKKAMELMRYIELIVKYKNGKTREMAPHGPQATLFPSDVLAEHKKNK